MPRNPGVTDEIIIKLYKSGTQTWYSDESFTGVR